jgi:MYXO-CTERM domain-containing protein
MLRRHPAAVLAALAAGALALGACKEPPDGPEPDESISKTVYGLTVDEIAAQGGCSTAVVRGLSEQILQVVNCARPGIYVEVPDRPNLSLGSAVFPFLEAPARDQLVATLDAHPSTTMNVTSMLRSVVQQYLLYYWFQHGQCGIGDAATPGNSQHESGLALDVSNYSTWRTALEAHDFTWYGAGDEVHFTYTGPGAVDLRSDSVLAFQKLWNHNHPGDPIAEDGDYGPQTGARIGQSPQDGFAAVPPCGPQQDAGAQEDAGAQDDAGTLPDDAAPAEDGGGGEDAEAVDAGADGGGTHGLGSACGCAAGRAGAGGAPVLVLVPLLALVGAGVALARRRRR